MFFDLFRAILIGEHFEMDISNGDRKMDSPHLGDFHWHFAKPRKITGRTAWGDIGLHIINIEALARRNNYKRPNVRRRIPIQVLRKRGDFIADLGARYMGGLRVVFPRCGIGRSQAVRFVKQSTFRSSINARRPYRLRAQNENAVEVSRGASRD